MLEHAVVGLDFSPVTEDLQRELPPLRQLGIRKLSLVTALGGPYPQAPEVRHRGHYLARLKSLADELDGFEVNIEVRDGRPADELRQAADESRAHVIVVGSRGHTPWRALFLGSTVLELARISRRPLLLLPLRESKPERGGGVLLATDGSASAEAAEQLALRLGQQLGGAATTVIPSGARHNEDAEQATTHLERVVGKVLTPHVRRGALPEEIRELADTQQSDVIIVGTRGRNPLSGLLLGSTAEHLLRTSNRPVLLVPNPDSNDRR